VSDVYVEYAAQLPAALAQARPGTRIHLQVATPMSPITFSGDFVLNASGTPDCPITISAVYPGTVTLSGSNFSASCLTLNGASHVIVRDIKLAQPIGVGGCGIALFGSSFNLVENVEFFSLSNAVVITDSDSNIFRKCNFSNINGESVRTVGKSVNNIITKCIFGESLAGPAVLFDVFSSKNRFVESTVKGEFITASYWVQVLGNDNIIARNSFKNVDDKKLTCAIHSFGSQNVFKANNFDLDNNYIYCIEESDSDRVCASNKEVNSAGLTKGRIDQSC